ncbi:hypothetical protein HYH03_017470 [Edaphochlamys debaryana]|uniref:Uncharacterized protein n=1 Tax=Edaphochlamys debaryana TaxID=47281 RepID=A0A835XIC6_9CHLO|nr:hypothetical protein HYH03_017470 [Edaphochlamys debaryana]|eukprot:KAG2483667.1 hypothetical protein HYH03_017470 [Edaphochlamys debaryana]
MAASDIGGWSSRLQALLPGEAARGSPAPAAPTPAPTGAAAPAPPRVPAASPATAPTAAAPEEPGLPLPDVPHLFAQRLDALPEPIIEAYLESVTALEPKQQGASWLPSWLGGGGGAPKEGRGGGGALRRPLSRGELQAELQRRRREGLPEDADSVDLSSEPYDTIPRQVQLQYRTYARLYPDEAAARARLTSMLAAGPGGPTAGPAGARAGPAASSAAVEGTARILGGLPSAGELQQSLLGLTLKAAAPGAEAGASAGARVAPAGYGQLAVGASGRRWALAARPDWADPVFRQLSRSLDRWYGMNDEAARPLRSGWRAQLQALYGAEMPPGWVERMRPAAAGGAGRGALRWVSGRPRVWVLAAEEEELEVGAGAEAGAGKVQLRPAEAVGGRGLVAAQAAAKQRAFVLRSTQLVPPEWL